MKIRLIFDVSEYLLYVPDGYIIDSKQTQMDFFEWCETQEEAFGIAPGQRFGWCYSKELFLQYINNIVLDQSREKAYYIEYQNNTRKKYPKIVF